MKSLPSGVPQQMPSPQSPITVSKLLDANIPSEDVKHRDQAGQKLSYLEAWYVIDRMNQVVGQGNWGYQVDNLTEVFKGEIEFRSGKFHCASYTAKVVVIATINGKGCVFSDVGYGEGQDKTHPGRAHELATKGAVSDGLKRALKNFGRSMGLALYDKTQEFVGGPSTQPTTVANNSPAEVNHKSSGNEDQSVSKPTTSTTTKTAAEPVRSAPSTVFKSKATKETITAIFNALKAGKKVTAESFKKTYLAGKGLSTLEDFQFAEVYDAISKDFPDYAPTMKGA